MTSIGSGNDVILEPFLMAEDPAKAEQELITLLSAHAEARLRGIVRNRLGMTQTPNGGFSDYEDLCSDVRTRLVGYLNDLKAGPTEPCQDFRGYVSAVAHNVCHDYFRRLYPARARLQKRLRDFLHAHPNFGIWKPNEEATADWVCGFDEWLGMRSSPGTSASISLLREDDRAPLALTGGRDVLGVELPWLDGVARAPAVRRLPVVLSRDEAARVLGAMRGTPRLMATLLYGNSTLWRRARASSGFPSASTGSTPTRRGASPGSGSSPQRGPTSTRRRAR